MISCRSWLLILLVFAACSRVPDFEPIDQSDCTLVSEEEATGFVERYTAGNESLASYQSRIEGRASEEGRGVSFKQIVSFSRPDQLRIDILSRGLSRATSMILIRGQRLFFFDHKERMVVEGLARRDNIERVAGVPFLPEELMNWLSGSAPALLSLDDRLVIGKSGYIWCVERVQGDVRERFNIVETAEQFQLQTFELTKSDELIFRSESMFEEGKLKRIVAHLPVAERRIEARFRQIRKNPPLDEETLFNLQAPPSYGVKYLY